MTDFIFPELGQKIITFLTARGIVVVTPSGQKCCGAPIFLGAGDLDNSRRLADANVEAFKDLDYIITDCATCASAMKGYAKHLADTGERHAAYNDHGNRIKDITEFLVDILDLPPSAYTVAPEFRGKKVTWHDPCHLSRYLKVTEQPRQILRSVADIKYEEMPHADICCGMAGTFALNADVLSRKIADRKTADIDASGADIVVTGCPGCRIQLTDAVLRHDMPQKVMHIMELFSA